MVPRKPPVVSCPAPWPKRLAHSLLPASLLMATLVSLPSCEKLPAREAPKAVAGVLDLSSWDFARQGMLELSGEWEFLPGRLVDRAGFGVAEAAVARRTVPDLWRRGVAGGPEGEGAGTYRLRIHLPLGVGDLAIRSRTVPTAFELDANGVTVLAVGRPAVEASRALPAYRPALAHLPTGAGGELELVVRVSNHEYRTGGLWRPFTIGLEAEVLEAKRKADVWINGQIAAIATIAAYALLIFAYRREDRTHLWFALFGIAMALRLLASDEYLLVGILPNLSFDALLRFEHVSAALPIPLLALFVTSLFPAEGRRWLAAAVCLIFGAWAALALPWSRLPFLSRTTPVFYVLAFAALAAYVGLVIGPALRRGRDGAISMLLGGIPFLATFAYDGLLRGHVIEGASLLGYGLLTFMLVQSGVLARRFSIAFRRGESLQRELSHANTRLARENELYKTAQEELRVALAEKDLLLREVHHRVKNSLQLVSSSLVLQSRRSGDPAEHEVYSMARSRIQAISLVHEKLYVRESAELLDLGEYATDLVGQLSGSYGDGPRGARIQVESVPVPAGVDDCVDFGLVLTELVSNACKHAACQERPASLSVKVWQEGPDALLLVEDDGPGFPSDFDPSSLGSLGFRVVSGIARKHGGEARVLSGPGGRVEVRFRLGEARLGSEG